ncbi:glycosyltransferase family 2 protein [Helicobacter cetorum]|uniref:glycosyltransferase family 2 protein n=1 Tax=Helicobacter cetorum TaxID=138563 RepID=UPI000CF154A1|nr:glycosyltransferase family 2 protein [Helicobacter cetorum]
MTISLIITTYNKENYLKLALDSALNLSLLPNEIIIADDGSKEPTRILIESYCEIFKKLGVTLKHAYQEDLGFRAAKSRNNAIALSESEYIVITDTDMILHKDFIKDHAYFAKEKTLLQGSRIILNQQESEHILNANDYKLAFNKNTLKNLRLPLISHLIYTLSLTTQKALLKTPLLSGIRSANMSFFKKDFENIQGFNENFVGWGREDSEFVARFLFNKGYLRRLKFSALAYHLFHKENSRNLLDKNHQLYLEILKAKSPLWR